MLDQFLTQSGMDTMSRLDYRKPCDDSESDENIIWEKVQMPYKLRQYGNIFYTPFDKKVIAATDENGFVTEKILRGRLEYLFRHGILDRLTDVNGEKEYKVASFMTRMNSFIVFEKSYWLSIPKEIRNEINDYCMDPKPWVEEREKRYYDHGLYEEILPIKEAIKRIKEHKGKDFYVAECNCNAFMMNCERDKMEVCIQFPHNKDDIRPLIDRGIYRPITREEAIEMMKYADSEGLIHKFGARKHKFCNCCRDCCIFHISREYEEKLKGNYLHISYVAVCDNDRCIGCGKCISRCQFDALELADGKIKVHKNDCWGCGLCMQGCSYEALSMKPVSM